MAQRMDAVEVNGRKLTFRHQNQTDVMSLQSSDEGEQEAFRPPSILTVSRSFRI